MRGIATLLTLTAAAVLFTVGACTSPVEADALRIDDESETVGSREALPSWSMLADAQPLPRDPGSQPHLELRLRDMDPDMYCGYEVLAHGFPALDEDEDGVVVDVGAWASSGSEGEDERGFLEWHRLGEDTEETTLYDRNSDRPWDEDAPGCEVAIAKVEARVAAANRRLAAGRWRKLEPLDVLGYNSGSPWFDTETDARIVALAPEARPVELLYNAEQLIARVRGVTVLERQSQPGWRQFEDEFCRTAPNIDGADVDRATGLALVRYDYSSGGCLCDDAEHRSLTRLAPETLAAVDARPTETLD